MGDRAVGGAAGNRSASDRDPQREKAERYAIVRRVTVVGAVVDGVLAVAKIAGGILGHSQALVVDGVHSASDLVTDAMVLLAARHAHADADEEHPYGHGRIETVATAVLGVVLIAIGIGVVVESVNRLLDPDAISVPEPWVLAIAAASVASKEALFHYTMRAARRLHSSLLRANAWHTRSDAVSSLVVIAGVGGALLGLPYLDALAAVIVAWLIARIGFDLAREAVLELIDTGLDPEQVDEIRRVILDVDGVEALHQLRTRQMGGRALVDVHVILRDPRISVSEGHQISERVRGRLIRQLSEVDDVTVHIDPEDDDIAPPSMHLPRRSEVLERLERAWRDIPVAAEARHLTLHYLDGRLSVDVEIPVEAASGRAELAALSDRLQAAARAAGVESVRVLLV